MVTVTIYAVSYFKLWIMPISFIHMCLFLFQKEIAELSSNVAGIHLDQLLDYSEKVEGKKGQVVIEKMFKELKTLTDDILKANDKRVQQGFLPYPYLLPEFICNSAST